MKTITEDRAGTVTAVWRPAPTYREARRISRERRAAQPTWKEIAWEIGLTPARCHTLMFGKRRPRRSTWPMLARMAQIIALRGLPPRRKREESPF